jgi:Polysaccharide lyase 14
LPARRGWGRHVLYLCRVFTFCVLTGLACSGHEAERIAPYPVTLRSVSQPRRAAEQTIWDGSPNLEPGLSASDILLFEDFEAHEYKDRWPVYWDQPVGAGVVSGPEKYVFAGNYSAYLEAKKGKHDSLGAGEYVPKQPIEDVAYMRLYLRLEDGFSMGTSQQLKLFTIHAGAELKDAYGGAGVHPSGSDKFSVCLAIDNWRALHFYYYHADQLHGYGDWTYCGGFFSAPKLSPGGWYCLELMVKANTPGQRDGCIKAWQDGRLIGEVKRLRFRDIETVRIRRFSVYLYFGGGEMADTSPKDQRLYVDNLVVSRKPIGPLAFSQ